MLSKYSQIKILTSNGMVTCTEYSVKNKADKSYVVGLDERGNPVRTFEWQTCTGIKSSDNDFYYEYDIVCLSTPKGLISGVVVFNEELASYMLKVGENAYVSAPFFKGNPIISNLLEEPDFCLSNISKDELESYGLCEKNNYELKGIETVSDGDNFITIYTDGGCENGLGGFAAVIVKNNKAIGQLSGSEFNTTNNRMELTAAIEALTFLKNNNMCGEIISDSTYVVDGATKWLPNWKRKGTLGEMKNSDLWIKIDELLSQVTVRFSWIKGHSGNEFNTMCDRLCVNEIHNLKSA